MPILRDTFFAEGPAEPGSRVALSPEETQHVNVRRVSPGEEVALFDGRGTQATARFLRMDGRKSGKRAAFEVLEVRPAPPDTETLVTVAAAIPKGPRQALLVRACTEVGVWRIVPLVTERSVVRPEKGRPNERWARVAREAAKQSRRSHVPEVTPVASFDEVLAHAEGHDLKLIADARPGGRVHDVVRTTRPGGSGPIDVRTTRPGSTPLREALPPRDGRPEGAGLRGARGPLHGSRDRTGPLARYWSA